MIRGRYEETAPVEFSLDRLTLYRRRLTLHCMKQMLLNANLHCHLSLTRCDVVHAVTILCGVYVRPID